MANGKITEAVQSGKDIRVTAEVDEGPVGIVAYTALVAIAELKLLDTPLKRRNALVAALKANRDQRLEQESMEAQLANLIGGTITL